MREREKRGSGGRKRITYREENGEAVTVLALDFSRPAQITRGSSSPVYRLFAIRSLR